MDSGDDRIFDAIFVSLRELREDIRLLSQKIDEFSKNTITRSEATKISQEIRYLMTENDNIQKKVYYLFGVFTAINSVIAILCKLFL